MIKFSSILDLQLQAVLQVRSEVSPDPIVDHFSDSSTDRVPRLSTTRVMLTHRVPRLISKGRCLIKRSVSKSAVEHTASDSQPIFTTEILKHLPSGKGATFLDATFGSGAHSRLLLDRLEDVILLAADCDREATECAERLSEVPEYNNSLFPIRSRFSTLPYALNALEVEPGTLDGMIIDTGCNEMQLQDVRRGFSPLNPDGILDLRYDPDLQPDLPTGSDLLQRLGERELQKILRQYGYMVRSGKFASNAILEARYMFHRFHSVGVRNYIFLRFVFLTLRIFLQEIASILQPAANEMAARTGEDPDTLHKRMLFGTITGLRSFINNDLHELEYALRVVAARYLRPDSGVLFLITHMNNEERIGRRCLVRSNVSDNVTQELRMTEDEVAKVKEEHPWDILCDVTKAQSKRKIEAGGLPGFGLSNLIIARKTKYHRVE